MKKLTIMIDGGYLSKIVPQKYFYSPECINKITKSLVEKDEELFKILYYDCPPFEVPNKSSKKDVYLNPKTKKRLETKKISLLNDLGKQPYYAIRSGKLKFRGWVYDDKGECSPNFIQKGVDMKIGLDMAHISNQLIEFC